jgi:hypothetical protein
VRKLEGGHRKKKPILNTIALVGDMVEDNIVDPLHKQAGKLVPALKPREHEEVQDTLSDYAMSESDDDDNDDDNDNDRTSQGGLARQSLYFYTRQVVARPIGALPNDVELDDVQKLAIDALEVDTFGNVATIFFLFVCIAHFSKKNNNRTSWRQTSSTETEIRVGKSIISILYARRASAVSQSQLVEQSRLLRLCATTARRASGIGAPLTAAAESDRCSTLCARYGGERCRRSRF